MRSFMKQKIAIFKPIDEEAFAPNNPRGNPGMFGSEGYRAGVLSGEACIWEVAAFLLDTNHFSSVPPTTFVEAVHSSFKYCPFDSIKASSKEF